MERPVKRDFKRPKHINDYPEGPQYEAGFLAETNASWRTYKPVVDVRYLLTMTIAKDVVFVQMNVR